MVINDGFYQEILPRKCIPIARAFKLSGVIKRERKMGRRELEE